MEVVSSLLDGSWTLLFAGMEVLGHVVLGGGERGSLASGAQETVWQRRTGLHDELVL
jgi:hypothetical protein